jgi:hypothetical protein
MHRLPAVANSLDAWEVGRWTHHSKLKWLVHYDLLHSYLK